MLYYEKVDNEKEEWVLFIHGLGGSTKTWKYQIEKFSKEYNLILVDLDGHGNSKENLDKSDYKPSDMAKGIDEVLVSESIDKVYIVALSLGTLIGLEYMRLYPDKVSSVILAGSIINLTPSRWFVLKAAKMTKYLMPIVVAYKIFAYIIMPKKNHKKARDIFVRESKNLNVKAFYQWVDSIGKSKKKLDEYIKTININHIPTLFVSGSEDYMFLKGIEKFCNNVKGLTIDKIKNCGHVVSIEKSDVFNSIALKFMKKKYIDIK